MGKLVVKGVLGFDEEDGSEIKEEAKTGKGKRRVNFDEVGAPNSSALSTLPT